MILRFVSRSGQFRLEVNPQNDFSSILALVVEKLPAKADPNSITVSNRPHGGDARKLSALKGYTFERIGLQ